MQATIKSPVTVYLSRQNAMNVCNKIQLDDPEWTYLVRETDKGFVIQVTDEFGNLLGYL